MFYLFLTFFLWHLQLVTPDLSAICFVFKWFTMHILSLLTVVTIQVWPNFGNKARPNETEIHEIGWLVSSQEEKLDPATSFISQCCSNQQWRQMDYVVCSYVPTETTGESYWGLLWHNQIRQWRNTLGSGIHVT